MSYKREKSDDKIRGAGCNPVIGAFGMKTAKFYFLALLAGILFAGTVAAGAEEKKAPTRITSENMTYSGKDRRVIFEKDVHAVREDFELWSDKLIVHLSRSPGKEKSGGKGFLADENSEVERITALGSVRIKSGERRGNCTKLVYETQTEIITMTGDPVLIQRENRISGKKIVINLGKDTSEVFSGEEKRVEALFYSRPEEEEKE